MHAFVLAGGFATRLWPLTEKRAKPLLPLAGTPIISHIVAGIPEEIPVTVSTNEAFKTTFFAWKEELGRANTEVLIEKTLSDDQKLGALGALAMWVSENNIDDDVLLLTGDNYFGFDMNDFLSEYNGNTLLAGHDIKDTKAASLFGTILLKENSLNGKKGDVDGFEEKPPEPKSTLISTGCSILPKETLPILLEFAKDHPDNVGGIFEELRRKNQSIECFVFEELWFDIGSFDAYMDATTLLVESNIKKHESSSMTDSVQNGSIVLGKNCSVKESECKDVVVFDDCIIEDCVLERCIIDNGCEIRGVDLYGKMIREGTRLVR